MKNQNFFFGVCCFDDISTFHRTNIQKTIFLLINAKKFKFFFFGTLIANLGDTPGKPSAKHNVTLVEGRKENRL